ncbi:MAG: LysR substrate-binding domain-containing protein [Pseudomonadota bacterium]
MSYDWRHLPTLSSLRALDATARHGGFSGAARALNVTHAAVAQQVRSLERELGVQLVVRTGRAIGLTEAGERLASSVGDGFAAIAKGVEALQTREKQRGLRVTTTTFLADSLILPRLSEFWRKHPDIEVSLMPSPQMLDIVREGYDLAIRAGYGHWPGVTNELLTKSRLIAVGAPHLVGDGTVDPASLPWLSIENERHDWILQRNRAIGTDNPHLVQVGSPHVELTATRQGLGMIIASEIVVRDDLVAGRLKELPMEGLRDVGYYALMAKGPQRTATRMFVSWLKTIV